MVADLSLHNIFFSEDYQKEFDLIFNKKSIPNDFTIYLHLSSVMNKDDSPTNGQNWFVMINTPAGITPTTDEKYAIRETILKVLEERLKVDISAHLKFEQIWDAKKIEEDTGSFAGAIYGAASNEKLSALKRHGNQIKEYPNLYFCGGTVHPGGGIPLVLKSAKIVANLIQYEK